jgi:hypothetical protein
MPGIFLTLLAAAGLASAPAPAALTADPALEQPCNADSGAQASSDPCGKPVGRAYGRHRASAGRGNVQRVFPPRHWRHHRHALVHRRRHHRARG